jgi:hypothetical protein
MHGMSTVGLDRLIARIDDAHQDWVDTLVDHNASLLSANNSLRRRLEAVRVRQVRLLVAGAIVGWIVGWVLDGSVAQIVDRALRSVGI